MSHTTDLAEIHAQDAAAIARVQAGDTDAYERLVLRYQDRIHALVLRMVRDRQDAEDLTQEAFIRAFRALHAFRAEASFHTWIFRIAVNTVISHRRKKQLPTAAAIGTSEPDDPVATIDPPDPRRSPDEALEAEERRKAVVHAVNTLDPEFRDAIALRDLQGCTYDQMAEILGCPVGTVKSRIHRARLALKEILAPLLGCI